MPISRSRHPRRWRISLLVIATLFVAAIVVQTSGGGKHSSPASAPEKTTLAVRRAPSLSAPISGESVVALPSGPLILGGLDSSEASVSGVFQVAARGGGLRPAGTLTSPLHDAAAALVGNQVLVFGGGAETSTDEVQALPAPGGAVPSGATASAVGRLPTARSDLSAVTIASRAYVLGGYDGETPLDSVLSTADGSGFSQVATLPQAARYMAVAVSGGKIYAFGGELASGASSDAIREVDPRTGTARIIGHLPRPASHAAAVVLGHRIYVLGGEANGTISDRIWRFAPADGTVAAAGRLPFPVAYAAATVVGSTAYLIGGKGLTGNSLRSVELLREHTVEAAGAEANAAGTPTGRSSGPPPPFVGRLLIADRGNNRLLLVNADKKILWRYPSKTRPAPPGGFYFPDDAFFTHGGTQIISNEEQNERIVQIGFPSGKLLWSYGHPHVAGSEPGYLHEPDDAYLLRDGTVTVADAQNCRLLLIAPSKKILKQFGEPSRCEHEPPHALGSPNGDTPLRDGNILVSEVNGSYIDEITPTGKLVWSVQLPIEYPSDPQQLGPDRYLVADYSDPGGLYEFNRAGRILWAYHPSSGRGMLNHPSLAERLPNGLICVNDDYRHRMVIIDPRTRKIVWQYGHTDSPGRSHGYLKIPDGFDLLGPEGTTPTHPYTG
jgi:outer membrane protein assembly factor BamB